MTDNWNSEDILSWAVISSKGSKREVGWKEDGQWGGEGVAENIIRNCLEQVMPPNVATKCLYYTKGPSRHLAGNESSSRSKYN